MPTRAPNNNIEQTMKIISLINQKGGVGKTTLSLHMATAFQLHGYNTILLDLDPQSSATEWYDSREDEFPAVRSIQPSRLEKTLEQAREIETDVVILDTAPHTESTAVAAARASDLILVPCQPKIMDLRAMRRTADLLRLVKTDAFVILNAVPHQGTVTDEAQEAIEGDIGLPVAPIRLGYRVAYDRSLIAGQTAQEFEPEGKAAQEIEALYMWACEHVNMTAQKGGADGQQILARA